MNVQSYQALADGIGAWGAGERRTKEEKLRQAMLKRQIEQDKLAEDDRAFDRAMKAKQIELAERGDKRADTKLASEAADTARAAVLAEAEAGRRATETAARVKLLDAQTTATAAKPASPVAAQLAGVEDFANNFAAALEENQAALTEIQNPQLQTNPDAFKAAQGRVLKAQIRLSALQQLSESWKKNAEHEPTVDLEFPGEDGVSKMKLKVPQSQWNTNHPMWGRFMTTQPAGPSGGSEQIPTLTPEQARTAAPGTKFRTTDGRIFIR